MLSINDFFACVTKYSVKGVYVYGILRVALDLENNVRLNSGLKMSCSILAVGFLTPSHPVFPFFPFHVNRCIYNCMSRLRKIGEKMKINSRRMVISSKSIRFTLKRLSQICLPLWPLSQKQSL